MKKIGILLVFVLGLMACKKEESIVVSGGQTVLHTGTICIKSLLKIVKDSIPDSSKPVSAYRVKISKLEVSRDAINWYTLLDSTKGKWIDLIKGSDSLILQDTLPVGLYQFAYIEIDSTLISRPTCTDFIDSTNINAVFTIEAASLSFGQKFLAYSDTTRIDTVTSDSITYTVDSLTYSSLVPPKIKHSSATDSLYWMLGGVGLQIKKDVHTEFIIALHPEVVNRNLQSEACGTGILTPLFIGTQIEYTLRDSIKVKY